MNEWRLPLLLDVCLPMALAPGCSDGAITDGAGVDGAGCPSALFWVAVVAMAGCTSGSINSTDGRERGRVDGAVAPAEAGVPVRDGAAMDAAMPTDAAVDAGSDVPPPPSDCAATDCYHVRAGASGSGADWNDPLPDLPETPRRGAIYFVADGSYSGHTFRTENSGSMLVTIKKATSADHGSSVGWSDDYGDGQAVFDGGFEFTTANWLVDGVTGGGAENNWDQNFGFKIVETGASTAVIRVGYSGSPSNITVRHVDMQGRGSVGAGGYAANDGIAVVGGARDVTLSYAWMHDLGRCPVFMAGGSSGEAMFEHIWVQSFHGSDDVHSEVMSAGQGPLANTTWRYSLITTVTSTGGLMWNNADSPSSSLHVYGNVFTPLGVWNNGANGIIGGWTRGTTNNIVVYNNTFINTDNHFTSFAGGSHSGNVAYNNLFYNADSPDFTLMRTHDYNHFVSSGGTHAEENGTTAAGGALFADVAGRDFRLGAPTPAGVSLETPFALDPLGATRGADGVWDRGAFEF